MATNINPVIYVDVLGTPYPTSQQLAQMNAYVSDLSSSGFQTAILYHMHIDAYGNFRSTNSQYPMIVDGRLQPGFAYLPGLIQSLTGDGSSIENVFFCLGGWGSEGDYVHAGHLLAQYPGLSNPLWRNFVALQSIGISGIDFDLEAGSPVPLSNPYGYYLPIVVQLTAMLANLHIDVTYCPYTSPDFWMACLASSYAQGVSQGSPVSWLNLQCYAGGAGNTQKQWVGYINDAQSAAQPEGLGISDATAFVVPGFGAASSKGSTATCPQGSGGLQSLFSDSSLMMPGIAGGFVFTYAGILQNQQSGACAPTNTTADYASAIVNGIQSLSKSG